MLYYSDAALRYAVDRCLEKDRYIVGIATKNKNDTIEKLLSREISTLKVRSRKHLFEIDFENGSRIMYIPISELSGKGYALNLLIVDEDVDDDILKKVLIPLEKLEWTRRKLKDYPSS